MNNTDFLKRTNTTNGSFIPCSVFLPSQEAFKSSLHESTVSDDHTYFTYKINQYGFRFDLTEKKNNICFVGCSITFGEGLAQTDIFPELVAKSLGNDWQCINLGVPGSGPDIQIINLTWAINNFKIDKIVWYMSDPLRHMSYSTSIQVHAPNFTTHDTHQRDFVNYIVKYEKTILLKTYWNIYSLFSLIKEKNIDLYFRCWIDDFHNEIKPMLNQFKFKELQPMNNVDLARDNLHPGIVSHKIFAEHILEKINEI
jgi:hypothetical protein